MSTIKIKTQRELESFLKVLAEESVLAAQASAMKSPEQSRQKALAKSISKGIASLNEEDPEDDAASPAASPEPKKEPAASPPPAEPEPKQNPAEKQQQIDTDFNPSLEFLIDAIKDMRGGKGTSDTIVKDSLSAYFDRLEDAERTSLIVMLRSIAGIMSGKYQDQPAPEPSDYQIFTTKKSPEPGQNQNTAITPSEPSPEQGGSPENAPEDTAPPIRVGEPVSEAYRAKIRNLLSKHS